MEQKLKTSWTKKKKKKKTLEALIGVDRTLPIERDKKHDVTCMKRATELQAPYPLWAKHEWKSSKITYGNEPKGPEFKPFPNT